MAATTTAPAPARIETDEVIASLKAELAEYKAKEAEAKAKAATANADLVEYVVLLAAMTWTTAKGKVARFDQGARLRLHSTEQRVIDAIGNGWIKKYKAGELLVSPTPAQVFAAFGFHDDVAADVVQDIQPVVPNDTVTAVK